MPTFQKDWCTVIEEDGMHYVITTNGSKIPAIIKTVTTDTTGLHPQCELTIHCNIAKDLEDAINKYQNNTI
jgi:hypothetical protein